MDLTIIPDALLQSWYVTAITAFNTRAVGGRAASVSYSTGDGSRSVSYSPANANDLRAWISSLANELHRRGLIAQPRRRRAIGVRFGGAPYCGGRY